MPYFFISASDFLSIHLIYLLFNGSPRPRYRDYQCETPMLMSNLNSVRNFVYY
jgi:hypothetical protein